MKILVLAGGFDQIALIKILQSQGHEVILADYYDNPPAKKYVDKHFQISTLDETKIYNLAIVEKVDLITTACTDQALLTVAKVSEKMGLPCYIGTETAQKVTNKAYMKKNLFELGIPTAQFIVLDELDNIGVILENMEFPLVVKPCDCNSSKGVVKVTNQLDLKKAIKNAFFYSRTKKAIVETFIKGEEISIDAWKDKEGVKILSISKTEKIKTTMGNFTIYRSVYPVDISDPMKIKIQTIAEKICGGFLIENSPVLIQAIIDDADINVIEFSIRMGGGSKYKLIEYISGVDIMNVYVNRILGDTTQVVLPNWSDKVVEIDYIYANNGIFSRLIGFEEALACGDISEMFQYKQAGSLIERRGTSSDRVVGFLIQADCGQALEEKRYRVLDQVDILDSEGNSMMYKACFYQE
ncbi:ATP-grasp domain-containing protein [bacterium D16-54]|nr:ATP-grasp domain-containing protein [bacterium D16-54]RKJ14071.1 ATP-grasp domain-containing protein [bacterium D16-56]